jgi:hypothetical protein
MSMSMSLRWLTAAVLLSGAAQADDTLERMRGCLIVADDAKRLACYDLEIGRLRPGHDADIGVTDALLRDKQRTAGITTPVAKEMRAEVRNVARRAYGKLVVTLDNDQVWEQQETVDFPLKPGDEITVRRGVLGALWMAKNGQNLQTRVKRIK